MYLDPFEGGQVIDHDEIAIQLREAIQREEESPVAMNSVIVE